MRVPGFVQKIIAGAAFGLAALGLTIPAQAGQDPNDYLCKTILMPKGITMGDEAKPYGEIKIEVSKESYGKGGEKIATGKKHYKRSKRQKALARLVTSLEKSVAANGGEMKLADLIAAQGTDNATQPTAIAMQMTAIANAELETAASLNTAKDNSNAEWEARFTELLPDWAKPLPEDDGSFAGNVALFNQALKAEAMEFERPGTNDARTELQNIVKSMARFAAANDGMPKSVTAFGGEDMLISSILADSLKEGDVGARVFTKNYLALIGESIRYQHAKMPQQQALAMAGMAQNLACMKEAARMSAAVADDKLSREAFNRLTDKSVEAIARANVSSYGTAPKAGYGCGAGQ